MSISAKQDIRNFITVLVLALIIAFLGAFGTIYYYGSTGQYVVEKVLIAPDIAQNLQYSEHTPHNKIKNSFAFSDIEFSYVEEKSGKRETLSVDLKEYGEFISMVGKEKSLPNPSKDIVALFERSQKAILNINFSGSNMRNESTSPVDIFQQVQFIPEGDYFRIELRQHDPSQRWAYFFYPRIYQQVLSLFVKDKGSTKT